MRDFTELAYEITTTIEGSANQQKAFTECFIDELAKEKSADIAPHLSCVLDVIKQEYVVTLTIPIGSDIFYSSGCNVK